MSALEEFPAELAIKDTGHSRRRWLLTISSPDVVGQATSSSREYVLAVAEAYADMRRDQAAAVIPS